MRLFRVYYRLQDSRWRNFKKLGLKYQTRYAPSSGWSKLVGAETPRAARQAVLDTEDYQRWYKALKKGYADWYADLLEPAVTSSEVKDVIWA